MNSSRRNFIKAAGLGGTSLAALPLVTASCSSASAEGHVSDAFSDGDVILFQGDSITDAGRNRERQWANDASSFGLGYAGLLAAEILHEAAAKDLKVYNRGISGNKVFQLADRWQEDCLDLKPSILSILIGVNDYWHTRDWDYQGTVETYERDLRSLLERTMDQLPQLKLVICQPFILTGTSAVDDSWLEPFGQYQAACRRVADDFSATWVPFQEAFDHALDSAPASYWAHDGVHPSMAGSALMAATWLKAVFG